MDNFDNLMNLSRKASGTTHPVIFSFWKAEAGAKPGIEAQGDDVIVTTKMGATAISVIVAGQHVG